MQRTASLTNAQMDIKTKRDEIKAVESREQALELISELDGNISLPILIQILEDIRLINENEIDSLLAGKLSADKLKHAEEYLKDGRTDPFSKYAEAIIGDFDKAAKHRIVNIKSELANKFVDDTIQSFLESCKLEGIQGDQREMLRNRLKIEIFLLGIHRIYVRADNEQRISTAQVIKKYAAKKGISLFGAMPVRYHIESPYKLCHLILSDCHISIPESMVRVWSEVSVWLEGMRRRTMKLYGVTERDESGEVKKDKNGNYLPKKGDAQDEGMYEHCEGLTKYYMSQYYQDLSNVIESMIASFPAEKKLSFVSKSPVVQGGIISNTDAAEKDKNTEVSEKDKGLPGRGVGSDSLPSAPIAKPVTGDRRLTELDRQASFTTLSESPGGFFNRKLSGHRAKSADDKITQLQRCLFMESTLAVSDEERADLDFTLGRLRVIAESYIKSAGYIRQNKNIDIAENILLKIDSQGQSASLRLYKVIEELVMLDKRRSLDLLPPIKTELLRLFENLTATMTDSVQMQVNVQVGMGFQ